MPRLQLPFTNVESLPETNSSKRNRRRRVNAFTPSNAWLDKEIRRLGDEADNSPLQQIGRTLTTDPGEKLDQWLKPASTGIRNNLRWWVGKEPIVPTVESANIPPRVRTGMMSDVLPTDQSLAAPAPKRQMSGPERLAAAIMSSRQDQIDQLRADRDQASTDISGWINDAREGITAARGDYNKAYSSLRRQGRRDTVGLARSGDAVTDRLLARNGDIGTDFMNKAGGSRNRWFTRAAEQNSLAGPVYQNQVRASFDDRINQANIERTKENMQILDSLAPTGNTFKDEQERVKAVQSDMQRIEEWKSKITDPRSVGYEDRIAPPVLGTAEGKRAFQLYGEPLLKDPKGKAQRQKRIKENAKLLGE